MKNLLAILLLCSFAPARASDSISSCLPKDVTQDTLVSTEGLTQKTVTVREALGRIGARCQKDKLVDRTGREVYFVHLIGCWGNPPDDYQEQLSFQAQEIQRLKGHYAVLEIPCGGINPRLIQ